MIDDEIKTKIIRNLAKRRPRNTIITELCETSGLKWGEAERLVNEIENDHALDIYSSQKPFLILLGRAIAVSGFILSTFILVQSINGLIIFLLRLPVPYLGNFVFFVLGILVFVGGLRGVIKLVRD